MCIIIIHNNVIIRIIVDNQKSSVYHFWGERDKDLERERLRDRLMERDGDLEKERDLDLWPLLLGLLRGGGEGSNKCSGDSEWNRLTCKGFWIAWGSLTFSWGNRNVSSFLDWGIVTSCDRCNNINTYACTICRRKNKPFTCTLISVEENKHSHTSWLVHNTNPGL